MPLNPRPMEVLKMACIQSPFLVPLGVAGSALVNNEVFIAQFYILGLMVLFGAHFFLAPLISGAGGRRSKAKFGTKSYSSSCDAFAIMGGSDYTSPAWSTSLMSFTFTYLLTPQLVNNYTTSPLFFVIFALFILLDVITRNNMGCFGDDGFIPGWMGLAFGGIMGLLWFGFVNYIVNPDFTFFNEPEGDRLKCNKPKKNHMKCTVYKDGVKKGSIFQ